MKKLPLLLLLAAVTLATAPGPKPTRKPVAATCVGANPCKACKNCKYCKRCAKGGKTCGICKK